ncbi:MAG: response regulator [Alphaproteobacteria bacterium]|jgi:two-component system chemotaxis response regulator CheY|nr:response regulator [Alphaproteobacteria bacterium]
MPNIEDVRILVIEDEEFIRTIIFQILSKLRVSKISEAVDGGEGFRKTMLMKPDLIFCDIHMEPVNGIQFLTKLRSFNKPEIANTPVVFLTSDTQESNVMKAKKLKVSGYMVKPVSVNDFKKQITRILKIDL